MERRNFLKTSLFGLFGLLIAPKVFSSIDANNIENDKHIKSESHNEELPKDLIIFAKYFSENHKILKCGIYTSDCGKYVINYEHILKDKITGGFIKTPYRVSHKDGVMCFSKSKCVNMPNSFIFNGIIWCYAITKVHISDYVKSDITSLKCSIENGFSNKELFINTTNIFKKNMTPMNMDRTNAIYKLLINK